jgi:hypothetical protein
MGQAHQALVCVDNLLGENVETLDTSYEVVLEINSDNLVYVHHQNPGQTD